MTLPDKLRDRPILAQASADPDDKFLAHRHRKTLERVERQTRSAALHPSDGRLCGTHSLRELSVRRPGLGS